ncbi:MAG: hypothetical protein KAS95_05495 [Candidatus Heimdallarchaeota archaeon]|nr:hypothetical protein [Candidatus Heimdallarchaeota archaeon]
MDDLTNSLIFNDSENITIPKEVIDDLSGISSLNKILSVYSSNARALYFFPVSSSVYKVCIHIFPLTPEIVAKIMTKISTIASKVIYSTGLCLVENRCLWEGFIQEKDLIEDIDEIQNTMSAMSEIKEIEVKLVHEH